MEKFVFEIFSRKGKPRISIIFLIILSLAPINPSARNTTTVQTFKDWKLQCDVIAEAGKKSCYLKQTAGLKKIGKPMYQMAVYHNKKSKKSFIVLTLPLGIPLSPGVFLKIDDGKPVMFSFNRCVPRGCRVRIALDDDLLKEFKAGGKVLITYRNIKQRPITTEISLFGFTAGLRALQFH